MKKIKRKIISIILIATMIMTNILSVYSADDGTNTESIASGVNVIVENETNNITTTKEYEYVTVSGGYAYIKKYNGNDKVIEIPTEIDGYPVIGINPGVYAGNTYLEEIIIPSTVTEFCDADFENCINLRKVTILAPLEYINNSTFAGCISLKEITLPDTVVGIKSDAFRDCTALEQINLPNSIVSIGWGAFAGCTALKEIILPDALEVIDYQAFSGCSSLEKVKTAANLWSFEGEVFRDCTSLKQVELEQGLLRIGDGTFQGCDALESISIPNSVKYIGAGAFAGCTALENITIPKSVEYIGGRAFSNTALSSVSILNDNTDIVNTAFGHYYDYVDNIGHNFVIRGNKGAVAEINAKINCFKFESLDGTYEADYYDLNSAYNTSLTNYEAVIEHLNEYYIEKYPEMALELIYGQSSDKEFFEEVARDIIYDSPDVSEPIALYNWMNENICEGAEYGYAMDVYNYRKADCMGNAILLCQLLRSVNIPAVFMYGYTEDFINKYTTDFMIKENPPTGHAWVLAYYAGQWMLLDSGMDRILYDKDEICSLYYTLAIEDFIAIYSDEYKPEIMGDGVYFKNGEYNYLLDGEYSGLSGGHSWNILPEDILVLWEGYSTIGNETFEIYGDCSAYIKNNSVSLTRSTRMIDDKLYYFDNHGSAYDITSLIGNYRMLYGRLVVDAGTNFSIKWVSVDEGDYTWASSNEDMIKVNEDGTFTVLTNKSSYGMERCDLYAIENPLCSISVWIDEFVTEISFEKDVYLTKKVEPVLELNLIKDGDSVIFNNYIWTSSDEKVAQVYDGGVVVPLGEGVTEITAMLGDGTGLKATCTVVVTSDDVNVKQDVNGENVYIVYDKNIVEDSINLYAENIEKNNEKYDSIKPREDVEFTAYEISLKDKLGNYKQPNGRIKVRIPCPRGFDGRKSRVYYVDMDGKYIEMKAEYSSGYIVFETNHFSTYIVTSNMLESGVVEVIFGDANGDGSISGKDVVLMKKFLAGYENLSIDLSACDVNADGDVSGKDVVKVMKYIAGYNVILGEK